MTTLVVENGNVLSLEERKTSKQVAQIKQFFCYLRRIEALVEESIVRLNWQIFDISSKQYIFDAANEEPFILNVDGSTMEIMPSQGTAVISREALGAASTLETINPSCENAVVVLSEDIVLPTSEEVQAQTLLNTEFLVVLAEITQM